MIERIFTRNDQRKCITDVYGGAELFQYHLVVMPTMKDVVIHRRLNLNRDLEEDIFTTPPRHEVHNYPHHKTLGPFQSHVQPHFVIFNAGQKISLLDPPALNALSLSIAPTFSSGVEAQASWALLCCSTLYHSWHTAVVPNSFAESPRDSHHPHSRSGSDRPSEDDLARNIFREEPQHPSGRRTRNSNRSATQFNTVQTPDLEQDHPGLQSNSSHGDFVEDSDREHGLFSCIPSFKYNIENWVKLGATESEMLGGWETNVFNDEQVRGPAKISL